MFNIVFRFPKIVLIDYTENTNYHSKLGNQFDQSLGNCLTKLFTRNPKNIHTQFLKVRGLINSQMRISISGQEPFGPKACLGKPRLCSSVRMPNAKRGIRQRSFPTATRSYLFINILNRFYSSSCSSFSNACFLSSSYLKLLYKLPQHKYIPHATKDPDTTNPIILAITSWKVGT